MKEGKPVFRFPLDGAIAIQDKDKDSAFQIINGGKIVLITESVDEKAREIRNPLIS
jgi:hypothetical protein